MLILSKCINLESKDIKKLKTALEEKVINNIVTAEGTDYLVREFETLDVEY